MADFVVGLTGGVASGKSEVSRRFEALGVTVVDADLVAREVVAPGSDGLAEVVQVFGEGALDAQGALDRRAMRARVFGNERERRKLEAIIHPRVRRSMRSACAAAPGAYAIAAIPLLAETGRGAYRWLHRVLVVDVPESVQRERLMRRDGIDRALADRMIAAQATRASRLELADDVLPNDGTLADLATRVVELHTKYCVLAGCD
ncbi:dephospho-CoA kinase [Luteimonas vadosa]|uniref:Dephospho-CoA kinase n=1 Tax=Luteimonas vadosa TaxID=1165507 RepID=A0ABP9DMS7_9GAMM